MAMKGSRIFTRAAVQRAMDKRAERWGIPNGYYTVGALRLRRLSLTEQIWEVSVRLFGGQVRHVEEIVFIRAGHVPEGEITYEGRAEKYVRKSGRPVRRDAGYKRGEPKPWVPRKPAGRKPEDPAAVAKRKIDYQESTRKEAIMSTTPWTHSEDRTLEMDLRNGVKLDETARKLGRTYFACSQRRVVLGLNPRPRKAVSDERS